MTLSEYKALEGLIDKYGEAKRNLHESIRDESLPREWRKGFIRDKNLIEEFIDELIKLRTSDSIWFGNIAKYKKESIAV